MQTRALVIDDAARERVKRVLAHAGQNHYRPGHGAVTPGDDARFVANLGSYRAVFSFTHADGKIYRHLSISIPTSKYAHPIAAFTIADLFGFTGHADMSEKPGEGWLIDLNQRDHCIVIAQPVRG